MEAHAARASVVIPAHNAAADIRACLEAVHASTARGLEILVVDDRSTDHTAEIARQTGARVVSNPGPIHGAAAARNVGARAAAGEVLVFVDADVCVGPDTIERALQQLEADPELGAITGAYDDEPHATGTVSEWRNLLHCYTHRIARADTDTFWTGFGAIRRDVYLDVGGLDPAFQSIEDMEMGARLRRKGVKLRLDASLEVQHRKRWTLASMLRTDLFGRAIPYARLMLREGMANDLNVRFSQRASVALTGLAIALAAIAPWIALLCLVAIAALNLDYYRFLARVRGAWFAVRTFPLHLLYFTTAGTGFAIAHLRYGAGTPFVAFFALVLAMQASQGAFGAEAYDADEPAHIVTGMMVRQYLTNGLGASPMAFARDYYEHYPKVALGHWPPVFYAMQTAWTLVFPATRDSLLGMIAVLAALLATGVWSIVRREFGTVAAWCAGIALLGTPGIATFSARVMTEVPMAVLLFAAFIAFARYLDTGRRSDAVSFGLLSLICLLTKGTALALAAVPPLGIVISGRWKLVRDANFWLPAAIAGLGAAWYLLAPGAMHEKAVAYGEPLFVNWRLRWPPWIWENQLGPVLAWLVLVGAAWLLVERARGIRPDGLRAAAFALATSGSVFPLFFGVWERRHQIEEVGAFVLLAAFGLGGAAKLIPGFGRAKAALAVLLAVSALGLSMRGLTTQPSPGFDAAAEALAASPARVVLVCCGSRSEGALIEAAAEREPTPKRHILRGTQVLGNASWMGRRVEPKVGSRADIERLLAESPLDWVVLDLRTEFGPGLRAMLEEALLEHPDEWIQQGRPPLVWFERAAPLRVGAAEREKRLRVLLPDPLR